MDFENGPLQRRHGSDADARRLVSVFKELGYDVIMNRNMKRNEMMSLFVDIANREELTSKQHDSLVVVVLSHGDRGKITTSDNYQVDIVKDIVQQFNNDLCPRLIGVPKIFFIQACRGHRYDTGFRLSVEDSFDAHQLVEGGLDAITGDDPSVALDSLTNDPAARREPHYQKDPSFSDIMISYSTVEGFVSLRREDIGSWYITSLAYVLSEYARSMSLTALLKNLNETVTKITNQDGHKQSPTFENLGFNSKFYFQPSIFQQRQQELAAMSASSENGVALESPIVEASREDEPLAATLETSGTETSPNVQVPVSRSPTDLKCQAL